MDVHNGEYSEQTLIPTHVVRCAEIPPRMIQALDAHSAAETISASLLDVLGTTIALNSPLMAAGLDSVAATEFASTLTERFDTEFPQTLLFDHPTIESVAGFVSETTVCESGFDANCVEVVEVVSEA